MLIARVGLRSPLVEGFRARRMLELAYEVGRAGDLESLRSVIASSLRRIVPGDSAGYTEIEPDNGKVTATTDPRGFPQELLESLGRFANQHPLISRSRGNAEAISDYLTQRRFQALELYQDFYRHVATKDQMAINLPGPPGRAIGVTVNRSRPGFSSRDREALDLLRPVLVRGYWQASARERARALLEELQGTRSETAAGVLALGADGRLELTSEHARSVLRRWFPQALGGHLPEVVAEWLAGLSSEHTGRLTIRRDGAVLQLTLALSGPGEPRVVELRERPAGSATAGLTTREQQVLRLVSSGASNLRVAQALGISKRTVDNHLEAIYHKLGVSNRTAAAAVLGATAREQSPTSSRNDGADSPGSS